MRKIFFLLIISILISATFVVDNTSNPVVYPTPTNVFYSPVSAIYLPVVIK